jgi:16S rRNA pseudouridine516 synthase
MELYKFLQQQGFGSRKTCRSMIEQGLIEFGGRTIVDINWPVPTESCELWRVDGEAWTPVEMPIYIALYKPENHETSHSPMHYPSVFSLLPPQFVQMGISAVGRLDADTTGLLLLTTDGQFVHRLTSPRHHVPKRYRVLLKHPLDEEQIGRLRAGVLLKDEDQPVLADAVEPVDSHILNLTISEGRYHQVKRMIAAAGNRVVGLHRESVGSLELGSLEPGQWRFLTQEERKLLGF